MSSAKFGYSEIARRYARVIFDLIVDSTKLSTFCEQLKALVDLFAHNKEVRSVFNSPIISAVTKKAVLEGFCKKLKVDKVATEFLLLVLRSNRMGILPEIYQSIQKLYYQKISVKKVQLIIPKEMSAAQYKSSKKQLEEKFGTDIELEIKIDPTLLGGVQIKVGSKLYDGSLVGKLNKLSVKSRVMLSTL